jgi:aryl-alcohol dehydrogenase-like predicted oxidoreductase
MGTVEGMPSTPLRTVTLGTGDAALEVSAVGLGCMGMSFAYGKGDDDRSLTVLARALELGVTFFDTANMYGVGHNEALIGRWLPSVRDQVVIATKFGIVFDPEDPSKRFIRGDAEYVGICCDESLQRLGVDEIDLYYQHRPDPSVPIEETVGAMGELVTAGKVKHLGLSEAAPDTIRRAHATHPITALQSEWSLWSRDIEDEVVGTARELGIGLVPYSPLGRGFLTGQITRFEDFAPDDFRRGNPRFQGENFDKNLAVVREVERLAEEKGVTAGQLALAWVLAQGDDVAPIPGTKRIPYLEENLGALDVQLTADELAAIEAVAPKGGFEGARYPNMDFVSGTTPAPAG